MRKCKLCKRALGDTIFARFKLRDADPFKLEFPTLQSMRTVETDLGPMHAECAETFEHALAQARAQ